MGTLVAYELTRHLNRQNGAHPTHLFASGYRAPHLPYKSALRHDLPKDEFIKELRNLNGTPKEALDSPELIEFMLPILRADCQICDLYEHENEEPLTCAITVYGGTEDGDAQQDALAAWQDLTCSEFDLKMFPGGHFFPQTSRQALLKTLSTELQRMIDKN